MVDDIEDIINTLIAEAGGQGEESMRRVAETIINRGAVRNQSFGDVVRAPYQYTGYSAPGPAAVQAQQSPQMQAAARRAWELALQPGDPTNGADHYFNPSIVDPGWQRSMQPRGNYGGHAYYASQPIPPNDLAAAVATMLDVVPQSRNVALPRPRPASPSDLANRLFTVTNQNIGVSRRPGLSNALGDYVAQQSAQTPLTRPQQIDRTVNAAQAGQNPLLARILEGYVQPKAPPQMTTAQLRADNGQNRRGSLSQSTQQSIASLFGMNGDPGTPAKGQTIASIATRPAPQMTTSQMRADNGQPRPSAIGKSPTSRMDGIGGPVVFGDIARMFGTPVPQARTSINDNKDQSRLTNTSVIGRADDKLLAEHGLATAGRPKTANVPLPRKRPQQAPSTQVAVTQPRKIMGMPTPTSQRPVAVAGGAGNPFAAPASSSRYTTRHPTVTARPVAQKPLSVTVYANHVPASSFGGGFNPNNHDPAQLAAIANGQSTFTPSGGGPSEPVRAMNGKIRNTY